MSFDKAFEKLGKNPIVAFKEAVRLLLKIADNILKNPSNPKVRTLQKSNSTISSKILFVDGATDCLKLMGFEEDSSTFTMPMHVSLKTVNDFKYAVQKWRKFNGKESAVVKSEMENSDKPSEANKIVKHKVESIIRKNVLPPLELSFSNPFLRKMETYFHSVLQYESKELQDRAKQLIPVTLLEINAQQKLRALQKHIKQNKLEDPELSVQDTLILELLTWFKEDFFSWVDSPKCTNCNGKTTFSHMCTDPNLLVYTDRVELHKCSSCNQLTPFPRFNDLNILLETRRGRCGEWANTFTLFCRAMGWDARFVVEEGDHVWTEVYSITQKRWLHCDPCENICDTPLVYENGWKKQISYVIAYSAEDVQDVTWRYSSYHKEVLKRRKNCTEKELLDALCKLREARHMDISKTRKKYLTNRLLSELVEFLTERKPNEDEQKGRSSGSQIWRLARGEIQETKNECLHIWQINDTDIVNNQVILRYSSSLDRYEYISGNKLILEVSQWNEGAYEHSDMLRKEEQDWKMVYLARKDGHATGKISWKVEIKNSTKSIDTVHLNFDYVTFENGVVSVKICSGDCCVVLPNDKMAVTSNNFSGSTSLIITASLSGGKGDASWQHAQLFRQSCENKDFPFELTITFK